MVVMKRKTLQEPELVPKTLAGLVRALPTSSPIANHNLVNIRSESRESKPYSGWSKPCLHTQPSQTTTRLTVEATAVPRSPSRPGQSHSHGPGPCKTYPGGLCYKPHTKVAGMLKTLCILRPNQVFYRVSRCKSVAYIFLVFDS